jgi:hypothetical protein
VTAYPNIVFRYGLPRWKRDLIHIVSKEMIRREKAEAADWDPAEDDETFEEMLMMLFPPDAGGLEAI